LTAPRAGLSDRITLPTARREFRSPSGKYRFVVQTPDEWKSLRGSGQLFALQGTTAVPLWQRELPHQFGPRYVLVSEAGQVLLFDEWINVKSGAALMLLGADGRVVTQYGFDAIVDRLGVPADELMSKARGGWWISAPPSLDGPGAAVTASVSAGDKVLRIHLPDGRLTVD
jgi:hypothetical protein